jgi:hypothetical protein
MLNNKKLYILKIIFSINQLISSETVSVIIPCHYKHFNYIDNLLRHYENQTILPDEIIISISEYFKIYQPDLIKTMEKSRKIPVKFILNKEYLYAGENRNKASEAASCDILIYNDADDIPFKQRVEAIKYLFQKLNIDCLIHGFIGTFEEYFTHFKQIKNFVKYHTYNDIFIENFSLIQYKKIDDINNLFNQSIPEACRVTFGSISIKKQVFNKLQWSNIKRGQDLEYLNQILNCKIFNAYFICQPLIIFFPNLGDMMNKYEDKE